MAKQNTIDPYDTLKPSEAYLDPLFEIYDKYYKWRVIQDSAWKEFQGMNLHQYLSVARSKMYGYLALSAEEEETNRPPFLTQEYRVQAEKDLTEMAAINEVPKFSSETGLPPSLSALLNAVYAQATKGSLRRMNKLMAEWHRIMDGTVIEYVSFSQQERTQKQIDYLNLSTGDVKYKEKKVRQGTVTTTIVDLEDFFFPKLFVRDLQAQGECLWRDLMTWSDFKKAYRGYPYAESVVPGTSIISSSMLSRMLDKSLLLQDKIEVIKYFDRIRDRYMLVANGIWINPMGKRGHEEVAPLPWNHKMLPFAKTVNSFIQDKFFYGNSLLHMIKSPVEFRENLQEMKMDRIMRAINPPILTQDPTITNGMQLNAGEVFRTQTDVTGWRELQMGEVDPNVWQADVELSAMTERIATPVNYGTTAGNSKQPVSANQNLTASQERNKTFNFKNLFYENFLEQEAILIVENALQFYTTTDLKKKIGEKTFMNIFQATNVYTPNGLSNLEIRFARNKKSISNQQDLLMEKIQRAMTNHENVDIIETSPEFFEDLEFQVNIDFDYSNSPELKKAMSLDFIQMLLKEFPQDIDRRKVLFRLFQIWQESPADYLPDQTVSLYPLYLMGIAAPQQNPMQPQAPPQQPQQNLPLMERIKQSQLRGVNSGRGNSGRKFGMGGINI